MYYESESLTKDWINFVVLIRTAKKTKRVKKIINAKRYVGILISPKETMNKLVKIFIKTNQYHKAILNQRIQKTNIYKVDNIKKPKAKR